MENSFLECDICLVSFTSVVPKILIACGHTLCCGCIQKIIVNRVALCPICGRVTTLETNNALDLPTNFLAKRVAEENEALFLKGKQKFKLCKEHSKKLELFCQHPDCMKLICCDCQGHKNHPYEFIEHAAIFYRRLFEEKMEEIAGLLPKIVNKVECLKTETEKLTERKNVAQVYIIIMFEKMKKLVEQRKLVLIEELYKEKANLLSELNNQYKVVEGKNFLDEVERMIESKSNIEFLLNFQTIQNILTLKENIHIKQKQSACLGFQTPTEKDLLYYVSSLKVTTADNTNNTENTTQSPRDRDANTTTTTNANTNTTTNTNTNNTENTTQSPRDRDANTNANVDTPTPNTSAQTTPERPSPSSSLNMEIEVHKSRDYTEIQPNGIQKPSRIFSFSWRFFSPQFLALIPKEWAALFKNKSNNPSPSSSSSSNSSSSGVVSDIIVTSDHGCQKVLLIETARGTIRSIIGGTIGSKQGELNNPKGLAVVKYRNDEANFEKVVVIVVDTNNNRVQTFDADSGEFLNQFTHRKYMKQPFAVAVNQSNQIIVANIDTNTLTIHKGYSNTNDNDTFGALIKVIGINDGIKFFHPHGVAVNSHGEIIISSDHKIDILDKRYNLIKSFGSQGKENGDFSQPIGLKCDASDNILVSDYDNCRVQVFNREGVWLHTFGKRGSGSGGTGCFFYLYDVLVDSENNIFVADGGNRRICKF